ncbi:MAG: alpha/beta hydrolase [Chloroflexi bacterium]|nr:alpha/beta hydrolase [Chloroflexota bacterium]
MTDTELTLKSKDGLTLIGRQWTPATARGVVALVHGFGEHVGRYSHVAAALNQAGYAMLGYDLRGHGRSGGQRGFTPSYDAFLDDIDLLLGEARTRFPGKPLFLYGHSLGGNLVLFYTLRRKPQLAGVVASAPQLRLAFKPPAWKTTMGRLMFNVWPGFSMPSGLEQAALSRDPEVVRAYAADPLVHDRVSARLGIGLIDVGNWLLEQASEFSLPLLVYSGSADRLTSPGACGEFAGKVRGDCTLKIWDGLYHETHNEPEKADVLGLMVRWIQDHTR